MVSGDLRPNLKSFEDENTIKDLEDKFFTSNITVSEKDGIKFDQNMDFDFHGISDGDTIVLEIPEDEDEENQKITIKVSPSTEDQLINLDIPPPIDEKSEVFFRIIDSEYRRIKASITKKLENENTIEKIKDYALLNIQYAKRLAIDTFLLNKVLQKKDVDDWDNSNTLIMYSLKKHLVYSIQILQETFNPILQIPIQLQSELEDELFDMQHTKMMSRINAMSKKREEFYLKRLYEEIGEKSSAIDKIIFFKKKLNNNDIKIEENRRKSFGIPKYLYDEKILLEKELTKLITTCYEEDLYNYPYSSTNENKYIHLLEFVTKLKLERNNNDIYFLSKGDFFDNAYLEIEKLEKILKIHQTSTINIKKELISILILLQSRKHLNLSEDQLNDYLTDLLRAKQFYISDQTRSGRSGSSKIKSYNSGELDIAIRDIKNNGIIITIIEAFELTSCGNKNTTIKYHINKLINRYDTAGNKENYIIIYAKATRFNELWKKFKTFVQQVVFNKNIEFIDDSDISSNKTDIKSGFHLLLREDKEIYINYLFVNMKI